VKRFTIAVRKLILPTARFLTAESRPGSPESVKLSEINLVPGMRPEAFIGTGVRTALDYPIRPLRVSFHEAFRIQ
jgi:hypothetical protein